MTSISGAGANLPQFVQRFQNSEIGQQIKEKVQSGEIEPDPARREARIERRTQISETAQSIKAGETTVTDNGDGSFTLTDASGESRTVNPAEVKAQVEEKLAENGIQVGEKFNQYTPFQDFLTAYAVDTEA